MLITIFYFSINIIGIIIINLLYKSKKKDFDINSQIKQSFTSLINLFDGWVFILDENYRIIEVGGKIEKIMRFELAQDFRRLMIELKCFPHLLQQDFEKDIFSQEIELMVNDNHNKYRISKSSFYSPKKRSVVTIADITSQKKIKNEAILNAERISLVLENSGLAFLDWDLKTNKVVHGEEFFKMLGQYSIEWKNDFSIWEAFVDPNQKAKLFEELNKCQIGRINHLLTQVKIKHRDGHWVNIHIQAKIVAHDALKRPERIMGSYLNLSNFQSDEKGGA
jgi:PAS domain-containing protein